MGPASTIPVLGEARRNRFVNRIQAGVRRAAERQRACVVAFAVIPVAIRLALLPWIPVPQPAVQDEFAYLLAGDTFASGRLTNPPHPLWVFFESVHIIQQPTYMAKYPPLAGLVLALGERLFGYPWTGVLLSMGILCGALAWAIQGWLPPLWALLGACLALLKIGILSYWSESYWGGAIAAIGGALVVGSVPRLVRHARLSTGLAAAIGLAILGLSRPFEGLILSVPCLGYLAWRMVRDSGTITIALSRLARGLAAPIVIVMIPAGAWTMFYNQRVTGNPLVLPYTVHEQQYAVDSVFFWQKSRPVPTYRHEALRQAWVDWDHHRKVIQRQQLVLTHLSSYFSLEDFFWGLPLFVLILFMAPAVAKSRRTRPAFWLGVLFAAGIGLELEFIPHYAAPAAALAFIVAAGAFRSLYHRYRGRKDWRGVVFALALSLITALFVMDLFKPEHRFLYDKRDFLSQRARVLDLLEHAPGRQLVFVRYGPGHDVNHEWVYNRADIDGSQIVWARSMGPEKDQALISYFKDRHVWVLEDNGAPRIFPGTSAWRQTAVHVAP